MKAFENGKDCLGMKSVWDGPMNCIHGIILVSKNCLVCRNHKTREWFGMEGVFIDHLKDVGFSVK